MQCGDAMRVTFIIGLVPAKSARSRKKIGTIVPPPPVDLLGSQHGVGVVPFARDAMRVHRGQRITSATFRAALMSNLARWQHPGITFDVNGAPRYLGPTRIMFVRDQKGQARSGSGIGVGFHVGTGRYLALQVGLAVNA
jgi:hypothetical protein